VTRNEAVELFLSLRSADSRQAQ